ncbi:MAG TPA: ABC transporter ATP-binding protein, partial [Ktedonobacterales bacterium]
MGFVMDGLDAEAYDRVYKDHVLVGRILRYFRPQGRLMLLVSAMTLLASILDAALPILIARGIDLYAASRSLIAITVIVGVVLVAGALSWTFNFIRQANTARAVGAVVLKLREDAFAATLDRDMSFYDEFASGKIVSRVTSDTEDFATVVTLTLNLLSQILMVVIVAAALFYISQSLAFIAIAIAPVCFVVALAFRRIARVTTQRARRALASVNALVQETMSGISVAKSFRQER